MSLQDLSQTAFAKYLIHHCRGPREATDHVVECLKNGSGDSQAWDLMAAVHGDDWKCPPEDLVGAAFIAVMHLHKQMSQ